MFLSLNGLIEVYEVFNLSVNSTSDEVIVGPLRGTLCSESLELLWVLHVAQDCEHGLRFDLEKYVEGRTISILLGRKDLAALALNKELLD